MRKTNKEWLDEFTFWWHKPGNIEISGSGDFDNIVDNFLIPLLKLKDIERDESLKMQITCIENKIDSFFPFSFTKDVDYNCKEMIRGKATETCIVMLTREEELILNTIINILRIYKKYERN